MTKIIVYGIKEKLNPIKAKLSDVIHGCMQSVLGTPEDKRAHRFDPMDKEILYSVSLEIDLWYNPPYKKEILRQLSTQTQITNTMETGFPLRGPTRYWEGT